MKKESSYKLHLRRLIDFWTPRSFFVLIFLKFLQFCRLAGFSAEKHGWRKVASIFVRSEYSKFMLATFRLKNEPPAPEENNNWIIRKLYDFMKDRPELHWCIKVGRYSFSPCENKYLDLIEAHVDQTGRIRELIPHFDPKHSPLSKVTKEQMHFLMKEVIDISNAFRYKPALVRLQMIRKTMRKRAAMASRFHILHRLRINSMIDRIMSAFFIFFEEMPTEPDTYLRKRFMIPDIHRYRHPGWGLLSIVARITPDRKETDLWWHFNHVVVDGAPMQEMLDDLKKHWGTVGDLFYPALNSPAAVPEKIFCGENVFRIRTFQNFSRMLAIRKFLNERFQKRMNGKASLGAMLMWVLAQHPFFSDKKMLMPVDAGEQDGKRELGLLVIRPDMFRKINALRGFLYFQNEINQRMDGIRSGKTESHEFLALCSIMHPILYHLAKRIIFPTLNDIVGTVGVTILRNADMFISPMTDMQTDGFISLGQAMVPTLDGQTAGVLCFSGNKEHLQDFLDAVKLINDPDIAFSPTPIRHKMFQRIGITPNFSQKFLTVPSPNREIPPQL